MKATFLILTMLLGLLVGSAATASSGSSVDADTIFNASHSLQLNLPTTAGSSGYLLSTDGAGNTSWVSGGGGGAATTALDNLASTAVNADISPDASAHNLGDFSGHPWNYVIANQFYGPAGDTTIAMASPDISIASSGGGHILSNVGIIFSDQGTINSQNQTGSTPSIGITLLSGNTVDGNSGDISLAPGAPTGSGNGGQVYINGGNNAGTGNGGSVNIAGGSGGSGGAGGGVNITTSSGAPGTSGSVSVQTAANTDGDSGTFSFQTGAVTQTTGGPFTSGSAYFATGNGSSGDVNSGPLSLFAGQATGSGNGGDTLLRSGPAAGSGNGGALNLLGADAVTGNGGGINITAGISTAGGNGGAIGITAGSGAIPGNISLAALGANISIQTNELTFQDTIHFNYNQNTPPTATPDANAGTGATCTVNATDSNGSITLVTGSAGWASGVQCELTFNHAWTNAPKCVLTPTNSDAALAAVNVFLTKTTTALDLNFVTANFVSTTYTWDFHCDQVN